MDDLQEILSFFIITKDELLIILAVVTGLIVLSFILPRIAFFLYEHTSSDVTQSMLKEVIYQLDKLADDLSNKEKRNRAVFNLQAIFSFKGIRIPKFILGWIVDMEVRQIRQLQKGCSKESNLHNDEDNNQ